MSSQASRITGISSVDSKLAALPSKPARRIVRKATNAGLKVLTDQIRTEIKAEPISPQLRRVVLRTVGRRFKKNVRTDQMEAKAGLGVGKKNKPAKRSGKNKGGVGINTRNLHWFALGTKQRRVKKSGQRSGRIKAVPAVSRAGQKAEGKAKTVMRDVALAEINAELAKL